MPADLRASNLAQADGIAEQLGLLGYQVRRAAGTPTLVAFSDDEIERLAEMEHGRWNAERLDAGWTWGPVCKPAAKTSPYLVPWSDLSEDIRDYDGGFVRGWAGAARRRGARGGAGVAARSFTTPTRPGHCCSASGGGAAAARQGLVGIALRGTAPVCGGVEGLWWSDGPCVGWRSVPELAECRPTQHPGQCQ